MTSITELEKLARAATPGPCDECGKPGVTQYDSQGEGLFWLCGSRTERHSDAHYKGQLIGHALPLEYRETILKLIERVRKLDKFVQSVAKQMTPEEFEEAEDDEPDESLFTEACERIILEAREALKKGEVK